MAPKPWKFQRCEVCGEVRAVSDFRYLNNKNRRDTVCLICRPQGSAKGNRATGKRKAQEDWFTVVRDPLDKGGFPAGAQFSELDVRAMLNRYSLAEGTVLERMGLQYVVRGGKMDVLADARDAETGKGF